MFVKSLRQPWCLYIHYHYHYHYHGGACAPPVKSADNRGGLPPPSRRRRRIHA